MALGTGTYLALTLQDLELTCMVTRFVSMCVDARFWIHTIALCLPVRSLGTKPCVNDNMFYCQLRTLWIALHWITMSVDKFSMRFTVNQCHWGAEWDCCDVRASLGTGSWAKNIGIWVEVVFCMWCLFKWNLNLCDDCQDANHWYYGWYLFPLFFLIFPVLLHALMPFFQT